MSATQDVAAPRLSTVPKTPDRSCSFCGAAEHEVERIIVGVRGAICSDCIDMCSDILTAGREEKSRRGWGNPERFVFWGVTS